MKTKHLQKRVSLVLLLLILVHQCFVASVKLSPWNRRIVRKPTGSTAAIVNSNDQHVNYKIRPSNPEQTYNNGQNGGIIIDGEYHDIGE